MNEHLFQILIVVSNGLCGLAWWSLRQEIRYVRGILTVQQRALEHRLEQVEAKCRNCSPLH